MFSVLCCAAQSQTALSPTATNPSGTFSNTASDTLTMTLSGNYNAAIGVQVKMQKTSGTMAGTVILYKSLFGTVGTWVSTGDTLTLANSTYNTAYWTKTQPTEKYWMLIASGGTTVVGTLSAKALGIKPN